MQVTPAVASKPKLGKRGAPLPADPAALPRRLTEHQAAEYLGFSPSYLRNLRVADSRRIEKRDAIVGPAWLKLGFAVRYDKQDLDAWLAKGRVTA
jgi:hypothetical protein